MQQKLNQAISYVDSRFAAALAAQNIGRLTAIQAAVYQPLLEKKSVVGLAPTGSGKTLAFGLPLFAQVASKADKLVHPLVLIVASSQELVVQTTNALRPFASAVGLSITPLSGGANIKRQQEKLKQKPNVVVGTLGRLLELIGSKKLKCHQLQAIVFDEADELLASKEKLSQARHLVSKADADAALAFFSATDGKVLHEVHRWFGREAQLIDVRQIDDSRGEVKHYLIDIPVRKKTAFLKRVAAMDKTTLVFFNQISSLKKAAATLQHDHVSATVLDANMSQIKRAQAIALVKKKKVKLLLTTDVAARGLDILSLDGVVNYDVPVKATTYIHRVGRVGRQKRSGFVLNLGNDHDLRNFKQLAKPLGYVLVPGRLYEHQIVATNAQLKKQPKVLANAKKAANPDIPQPAPNNKKKKKKNRWKKQKNKGMRRIKEK